MTQKVSYHMSYLTPLKITTAEHCIKLLNPRATEPAIKACDFPCQDLHHSTILKDVKRQPVVPLSVIHRQNRLVCKEQS